MSTPQPKKNRRGGRGGGRGQQRGGGRGGGRGNNNSSNSNNKGGRHNNGSARTQKTQGATTTKSKSSPSIPNDCKGTILVLHGNRQTGQLLLGRLEKLQKRIWKEFQYQFVAPDAPHVHPEDSNLRTWWNRNENHYDGLERSLEMIQEISIKPEAASASVRDVPTSNNNNNNIIVGILGFSQGARLAHLVALLHDQNPSLWFSHLQFVILVAGYDAPIPDNFPKSSSSTSLETSSTPIHLASLHVWGVLDSLVTPDQSQATLPHYDATFNIRKTYEHDGKHHVPTKTPDVQIYIEFLQQVLGSIQKTSNDKAKPASSSSTVPLTKPTIDSSKSTASSVRETATKKETTTASSFAGAATPKTTASNANTSSTDSTHQQFSAFEQQPQRHVTRNDDCAVMQRDEVQVLEAMFPEEFELLSSKRMVNEVEEEYEYGYPIVYKLKLLPSNEQQGTEEEENNWPPNPLTVQVMYPFDYPLKSIPVFKLVHDNTVYQFPPIKVKSLLDAMKDRATVEIDLESPCILICMDAGREYLDSPDTIKVDTSKYLQRDDQSKDGVSASHDVRGEGENENSDVTSKKNTVSLPKASSVEKIQNSNMEGLSIAEEILNINHQQSDSLATNNNTNNRKGGPFFNYTIGLVGKPSAGKSTFFNAATAFGRQRGVSGGGNNDDGDSTALGGASMAPHPFTTIDPNIGYCLIPAPEGSCPEDCDEIEKLKSFGSTHGRDAQGRRFLPVLLKDVAGLVPGAYQGKGRGNQFLNDLCDATVLIHVVDASGTADAQGNTTIATEEDTDYTNPLDDLSWIRNELVEWIYTNLLAKWETICRKGRTKLSGMFSGYGQNQAVTDSIFAGVEKFLEQHQQRNQPLDHIHEWDQADVHRLVSAFLGVRFPMALALNKCDLPSSVSNVAAIQAALPIHGAYVGIPMTARSEMTFVRDHLLKKPNPSDENPNQSPVGVWKCLTSAMMLREPILVFPVSDLTTYAPMAGMDGLAVGNASLPSPAMLTCIKGAGGSTPTCWDEERATYILPTSKGKLKGNRMLRDVLLMKPGSVVEDVFLTLKRLGALSGDFVRAEGAGNIGEKPKPIPKHDFIGKHNRILKIMSNKRTTWQK